MAIKVISKLSVCTDCIMYLANGELPYPAPTPIEEALNNKFLENVNKKERDFAARKEHIACGNAEYGFCVTACQLCGSPLHGHRHEAVVLKETKSREEYEQ